MVDDFLSMNEEDYFGGEVLGDDFFVSDSEYDISIDDVF